MARAIQVKDLRKAYGTVEAVAGISFEVVEGECFALLGPNGAGKTTTLEILEGYRDRSGGSVEVLGADPAHGGRDLRERVGIVLQSGRHRARADRRRGRGPVRRLLPAPPRPGRGDSSLVGLGDKRDARCRTLSGGQQRRLDLALGIVGDPDFSSWDEPTTGFDPSARRRSWELIENLRDLGKTILLTTHYMDEAQNLADRVAIITAGQIVASGTPEVAGRARRGRERWSPSASRRARPGRPAGRAARPAGGPRRPGRAGHHRADRALHVLTGWALERGEELGRPHRDPAVLEDVYLRLTGAEELTMPDPPPPPSPHPPGDLAGAAAPDPPPEQAVPA
jgi:ABC-2 type transport system ATP-binding protein